MVYPKKIILAALCLSALITSCAKDEPEPTPEPTAPVNTTPPLFHWTPTPGTLVQADSSACYVNSNVLFGYKNGNSHIVEVRLSSMNTGTYEISSATGNELDYFVNNKLHIGTGTFVITASSTSTMSGNFTCSLSGGTLTGISGTFAAVPKRYN